MANNPRPVPVAEVDGVTLLSAGQQRWRQTAGVTPVAMAFDVSPAGLAKLMENGGHTQPKTLKLSDGRQFKFVYVVKPLPGENPFLAKVLIADERWWFKYKLVGKRYNMRRNVGTARRGEFQAELQQDVVPEVQYARYSKDPSTGLPWTSLDMLVDVLTSPEAIALPMERLILDASLNELSQLPVDKLELTDRGDMALQRALGHIAGATITQDPDGMIRLLSRLSGGEAAIVGTGDPESPGGAGPEIAGGGHIQVDDRVYESPAAIDVYVPMEVELRIDFTTDDLGGRTVTEDDPPLAAFNVLPLPDFSLKLANGETAYQNTYVTFKDVLDAWPSGTGLIKTLSEDTINKAMIPGVGLLASLEILGKLDLTGAHADWSARVQAIRRHWRQTFMIHPQWNDNVLAWRDYLVATIDVVRGQRAPARAYSDHCSVPSRKARLREAFFTGEVSFGFNVDGYPGEGVEITADTKPSPATVRVLDSDQGVVRVDYNNDPFDRTETVLPSKVDNLPQKNFRRSNESTPVGWNSMSVRSGKVPKLSDDQQVAILLTAIPASPNSKRQYYRIRVTPEDVADLLPPSMRAGLAKARGPVQEVFTSVETARLRWKETARPTIKRIFGIGGQIGDPRTELKELVINDREDQKEIGENAASLPNVARALAASIWSTHRPGPHGSMTGGPKGDARISGAIKDISHILGAKGEELTQWSLPEEVDPLSFFSLMPDSTRAILMRLPQEGK